MWKTKTVRFLYYAVASRLPSVYISKSQFPKKFCDWCARFLLDGCGENVTIEPRVQLRWAELSWVIIQELAKDLLSGVQQSSAMML